VSDAINGLIKLFKDIFGIHSPSTVFASMGADIINGLWKGIKDTWNLGVSFFESLPQIIKNAIGDGLTDLVDIGVNLITGLWNGIKSMGGWLTTKIEQFVTDNIPGPIRSILKMASPSKLMADEVGAMIPAGIAIGINQHAGLVSGAMAQIGNNVAKTKLTAPGIGSTRSNGAAANGVTIVNNNYQTPGQDMTSFAAVVSRTTARSMR